MIANILESSYFLFCFKLGLDLALLNSDPKLIMLISFHGIYVVVDTSVFVKIGLP